MILRVAHVDLLACVPAWIWLRQSLDIMVSYDVQYQKKLMIQSWENYVTDGRTDESDLVERPKQEK